MRRQTDMGIEKREIPHEVYFRAMWTIRDTRRLRQAAELSGEWDQAYADELSVLTAKVNGVAYRAHILSEEAPDRALAELRCISEALLEVPETYREGVLRNIVDKEPFSDYAHPNTWKRWKHFFIAETARKMHMI